MLGFESKASLKDPVDTVNVKLIKILLIMLHSYFHIHNEKTDQLRRILRISLLGYASVIQIGANNLSS